MMAYVDAAYYGTTYNGQSAGADFDRLAARASDDITLACPCADKDDDGNIDLTDLTLAEAALLKKATCAQLEWYVLNGDSFNETMDVGGESIGGFSRQRNLTQRKGPMALAPRAMSYLEQTGLMSRAVRALR